ncbi:MAG: hypothetical protein CK552_05320 [Actinobacteria bacterium]|nr:MAG: hypothetical protein CK552_05320 [Actinomycetota bacterium]
MKDDWSQEVIDRLGQHGVQPSTTAMGVGLQPGGLALDAVPVMDSRVGLARSLILQHAHLGRRRLEVFFACSPIPELITLR